MSRPAAGPARRMRRGLTAVAALLLVLALGAGAFYVLGDPRRAEPVETDRVRLQDIAFDRPVITVTAGTTVTWTFADREAHDVTGDGWASPLMVEGDFSHTFTEVGTHDYVCTLHPIGMRGRVVVTP